MADSLVGIHPHPGPTRRGVRSGGGLKVEEGEMRLGGKGGGGGAGGGSVWVWGRGWEFWG